MSLILNIDTALDVASVCLAKDGSVLQLAFNKEQKDHASWLHTTIAKMLEECGYKPADLSAVAVSLGPGSYTGLRVGLASAKGLCYALNIRLIGVGTLEMLAYAVRDEAKNVDLICPMIDARRMEVFLALFDTELSEKLPPKSEVFKMGEIPHYFLDAKILFCGNGSEKLKNILSGPNAVFSDIIADASHLSALSLKRFRRNEFKDLAYTEPMYVKEFYSIARDV